VIHRHHRKLRSQGGADTAPNVILIPDSLHAWIHANPQKAYELGLMVKSYDDPADIEITIPEELLKKPRTPRERKPEKPRNRVNVTVNVPKDEREDGAGILDDLIQQSREMLAEALGWEDNVPAYFVLVAVLHDWLTGQQSIAELENDDKYGDDRDSVSRGWLGP